MLRTRRSVGAPQVLGEWPEMLVAVVSSSIDKLGTEDSERPDSKLLKAALEEGGEGGGPLRSSSRGFI